MGGNVPTGDVLGLDAKVVYAQLLAVADYASELRHAPGTCRTDEVDGLLEAYEAARTLCHEITREEITAVVLPELGRLAEDKQYDWADLRAILTSVELECFKGIGTLASIIASIPKEEASKS